MLQKLDKNVKIDSEDLEWDCSSVEGHHGHILTCTDKCECGEYHSIEIERW